MLCGSAYRNRGIEPLLDAVLAYLPSPLDVPPVRGAHDGVEEERTADPAAPLAALAFKVTATATGRLTYLRVYSGTIEQGDTVRDATAGRAERVGRILRVHADRHTRLDRAVAGDIVAVVGLKAARAGATLCAPDAPLVLEPPGTAEPVVSVAVEALRGTDTGRLASALARLAEEDPSLVVRTDAETGQTVLSGMGELHLEVAVERIRREHGLGVAVGRPRVSHRETVGHGVSGFVYRHVKQDGGAGQFAHVVLDVEPLGDAESGSAEGGSAEGGFVFRSTVVGGRVPQEYVRAVERLPGRARRGTPRRTPGDGSAGDAHRRFDARQGLLRHRLPDRGPARTAGRPAGVRDGGAGTGRRGHGDGAAGRGGVRTR